MKEIKGFDSVMEAGEFKKLPAGIYITQITAVNDVPASEYLEISLEIVKGDYAGYFGSMKATTGKDYSKTIRSYKTNALPFFKAFITAVEKTNKGYKWDWHEEKLVGKYVVAVFGEEEYVDKNSNEVKVSTKVQEFRSGDAYKEGRITVPPLKKLKPEQLPQPIATGNAVQETTVSDDDLPF